METGAYIVKERCSTGLGILVTHFSEQRRRFSVVDDPAIVAAAPAGMLPVVSRTAKTQGGRHVGMGSLAN